jgi:hypothetical protein
MLAARERRRLLIDLLEHNPQRADGGRVDTDEHANESPISGNAYI